MNEGRMAPTTFRSLVLGRHACPCRCTEAILEEGSSCTHVCHTATKNVHRTHMNNRAMMISFRRIAYRLHLPPRIRCRPVLIQIIATVAKVIITTKDKNVAVVDGHGMPVTTGGKLTFTLFQVLPSPGIFRKQEKRLERDSGSEEHR